MKYILILIFFGLFSCKKNENIDKTEMAESQTETIAATIIETDERLTEVYGSYVGMFRSVDASNNYTYDSDTKINLIIREIVGDVVKGESIVSGNVRPFIGKINSEHSGINIKANEPGNDKHDGVFDFTILGDSINGTWEIYDKKIKFPNKKFKLEKQEFVYNPENKLPSDQEFIDYYTTKKSTPKLEGETEYDEEAAYRTASDIITKLNGSTQKFRENDLKNLKKLELEIIRNTIYARHGYSFRKKTFKQFFDPVKWYVPVSNNVDAELSSLEKSNIKMLLKFEKYATDNYESFGR